MYTGSYLKGENWKKWEIERDTCRYVGLLGFEMLCPQFQYLLSYFLQSLHGSKCCNSCYFVSLSVCIITSEPLGHCLSWDWTSFWWSLMEAILFSSDWRRSSLGDSLLPSLSIVFEGSGNCERYENNLLLLIVSNRKNKTLKSWKYPMAILKVFK